MRKLLSAGLIRLRKSRIFWLLSGFMLAFGLYYPIALRMQADKYGFTATIESPFFTHIMLMGVLTSIFISLFIGTEYNDGTMRNKLIAGHSRTAVYFSFLIVSIAAIFLMCLAYLISSLCTGIPLLGFFSDAAFPIVLGHIGTIFILAVAFTSICTAAAMLCQNKAATATVCILGVFIFLFFGAYIRARLEEPEYDQAYYFETEETSEAESAPPTPNPWYVSGTKRQVYEFLHDFLPGNQAMQLCTLSADNLWKMSFYSILIAAVVTGTGIYVFYRENIN